MKYYSYWIAIVVFVLDQITKKIVAERMEIGQTISVIGEFFKLNSIRNTGAAFSMLPDQRIFFIVVSSAVVIGILWYIGRNRKAGRPLLLSGLGMILGGAVGNLFDRALYGEVVDFFQFTFGSYVFPIFNVADIGITVGVALILLETLLDMKKEGASAPQNGDMTIDGNTEDGERREQLR